MRASLRLVWRLGVMHLRAHRLRLLLSVSGIAAGVALVVAVLGLTSSIRDSERNIATTISSRANVEVRPAAVGMPDAVVDAVRRVPGVRTAGGTLESYTVLRSGSHVQRALLLGLDAGVLDLNATASRALAAFADRALDAAGSAGVDDFGAGAVFSRPGSEGVASLFDAPGSEPGRVSVAAGIALTPDLARALDVREGDGVEVFSTGGWREARVFAVTSAVHRPGIAVAPIETVQDLLARPGVVGTVYAEVDDPRARMAELQLAVGARGRVGPPGFGYTDVQQVLQLGLAALAIASLVALFVGGFLVYNTMAMAATERIRDAAILRAVGARRRQLFALFCTEGLTLGIVGSVVGTGFGVVLAELLLTARGGFIEQFFPAHFTLVLEPSKILLAATGGAVTALAASAIPARRVAAVETAAALGPTGAFEDPTGGSDRLTAVAGVALAAAGVGLTAVFFATSEVRTGTAGTACALAGSALLIRPVVPRLVTAVLGPFVRARGARPVWRLAADGMLRSPGRTSFTVGAVFLSLTLMVGFGVGFTSFARVFNARFSEILGADLFVVADTWRPNGADVPLDPAIATQIERIPGVAVAVPHRFVLGAVGTQAVLLGAMDFTKYARQPHLQPSWRAQTAEFARALSAPNSVLVTPTATSQLGFKEGDTIELPTPDGATRYRVVGTYLYPGAVLPTLYFDFEQFGRDWHDPGSDTFTVAVEPGADVRRVRADITQTLGADRGLAVLTGDEFRGRVLSVLGSFTSVVSSAQLVGVLVATLALANTLTISTLERRRELALLRALGQQRGQQRRMIGTEAVLVALFGTFLAWGLGSGLGVLFAKIQEVQLGIPVPVVFPALVYAQAAALGVAAACVASVYPAWRAARQSVSEGLQFE